MERTVARLSQWASPAVLTLAVLIALIVAATALSAWLPADGLRALSSQSSAAEAPRVLGRASEAGGVIFATSGGVWRYDGTGGTIARLGTRGRPTADGRQFVVVGDDARLYLADAALGTIGELAPAAAIDADWIGGGKPMVFIDSETVTWYLGVRAQTVPVAGARYVRLSPDGHRALIGTATNANTLTLVDLSSLTPRNLLSVPASQAISPAAWSPDSRFFAYFIRSSAAAPRVDLQVVDVETGAVTELGASPGASSDLRWAAPHWLAYVAGGQPETWSNKTMRVWAPERGLRDVTGANEIGLNPSWSADGRRLYFIRAGIGYPDPVDFSAGRAMGDRRVAIFDLASGNVDALPAQADVTEGVRAARSGGLLLRVSRPRAASASPIGPPVPLELSLFDPLSQHITKLAQIDAGGGTTPLGRYVSPEAMAWSR
jgi:hypothetical protein